MSYHAYMLRVLVLPGAPSPHVELCTSRSSSARRYKVDGGGGGAKPVVVRIILLIDSPRAFSLSLSLFCVCFQNLVKRDRDGYRDEFLQQHRNYLSELEIFKLKVLCVCVCVCLFV